jgi:hypothetical protein
MDKREEQFISGVQSEHSPSGPTIHSKLLGAPPRPVISDRFG